MALRTRNTTSASIWPGFVDAVTSLLMVLIFVLTIFIVVAFVLKETISGQETELDNLNVQIADLADALGLERNRTASLEDQVGSLNATIATQADEAAAREALIARLNATITDQSDELAALGGQITDFEAQVAALIASRDEQAGTIADLRSAAEAREVRLTEALAALDAGKAQNAALSDQLAAAEDTLTEAEKQRLAEAAAAEALRTRLANSDAELTALTLELEKRRQEAEDTLTLLAAAEAAKTDLDAKLAAALADAEDLRATAGTSDEIRDQLAAALAAKLAAEQGQTEAMTEAERQAALLATARDRLSQEEAVSAEAQRQVALLNEQMAALRLQLGALENLLDESDSRDAEAKVQIEALGSRLNAALAQVAAEAKKSAALEAAERARLEAEAKDLANYRSEFFGKLRQVLGDREGVRIVGDRFVFSSEVLFAPGKADLEPGGRDQIARVAAILQEVAGEIPANIDWVVRVDGHTDKTQLGANSEFADNWELSTARALAVVHYMTDQLGFPPDRLAATGFGEYSPVDPGDSKEALAANRRIELKLTEK